MRYLLRRFLAARLDPHAAEAADRASMALHLLEQAARPATVRIYHGDKQVDVEPMGWTAYDRELVDRARAVLRGDLWQ